MGLLTPWFLAGLAAVGLPVWLHLLRKHRSTPQPFSSLMFFERRTQSSIKHRRLRYLVLFTLRTLLIVLLALAFAHPYITRRVLPTSRTDEVTVLAVDNSLSMLAGDRLNQAKQMAKSVVGGLHPGERAEVLAFGSRVEAMGEVTDDHAPLNAAIDAIQPSDARTSFAELARSLRAIAQSLHLPLHVRLYSDMQQSGMPANFNDLRLNADVRLEPHAVGYAGDSQLHSGERGGAAARLRWRQAARAGHRRRLRHSQIRPPAFRCCSTAASSKPSPSKCPKAAAPRWNFSRSKCPTAATRAR